MEKFLSVFFFLIDSSLGQVYRVIIYFGKNSPFVGIQFCAFFKQFFKRLIDWLIFRDRREGERERNIDVRERLISCLLYTPQPGTKPATQACALAGNWTGDFSVCNVLNQLSHTGQGSSVHFDKHIEPYNHHQNQDREYSLHSSFLVPLHSQSPSALCFSVFILQNNLAS